MRLRRSSRKTSASLLLLTAAVAVTTIVQGVAAPAQEYQARGSSGASAARAGNDFGIRVGSTTGLVPKGEVIVPVRYSNPFKHRLVVRSQIQVTSPSEACPAVNVDLASARAVLARSVVVPARKTKTVEVVLSMLAAAPDACQGVRFTTTVRARGRKS